MAYGSRAPPLCTHADNADAMEAAEKLQWKEQIWKGATKDALRTAHTDPSCDHKHEDGKGSQENKNNCIS